MSLNVKLAAARSVGRLARRAGRGGGTSLPGKVLLRLEPRAIAGLARRLRERAAVISATNGKTTTAAMVAGILERRGETLVHNRAGANMAGGVASALLEAAEPNDGIAGDRGLFEVDELWLERVVDELDPGAILLSNLFRDQLDRYGELETIADRWAAVARERAGRSRLVLNADDPLVADLGRGTADALYFGVDDDVLALPELQHASDSKHCRRCGHAYVYEAVYLAHLGHYHCPNCGARRPEPAVTAEDVALDGVRAARFTLCEGIQRAEVSLPLPGLYNVYNALGAAALCRALGVPLDEVADGLAHIAAAFGRAEVIDVGGAPMTILLIKNPAGANEVLRTLALEAGELELLAVLNDNIADGRDVSWVWDADFESLAPSVGHAVCAGTRAAELALRLRYGGVPEDRLEVVGDLDAALDRALERTRAQSGRMLYALPTYTALLELRGLLSKRGHAERYWA